MELVDPAALQCFAEEIQKHSATEEDWDFAYRCQIEEAIAASLRARNGTSSGGRKCRRGSTESPGRGIHSEDVENEILRMLGAERQANQDSAVAFALQNEMLRLVPAIAADHHLAENEGRKEQREFDFRMHDRAFATSLSEMAQEEWGDEYDSAENLCEGPGANAALPFVLHFATAVSEEEKQTVASGAFIENAEGNVIWEWKGVMDSSTTCPGLHRAEFSALTEGLSMAQSLDIRNLVIRGRSAMFLERHGIASMESGDYILQLAETIQTMQSAIGNCIVGRGQRPKSLARKLAESALGSERVVRRTQSRGMSGDGSHAGRSRNPLPCAICLEMHPPQSVHTVQACGHTFCNTCLSKHAQVKVHDNQLPVRCPQPDCEQLLSQPELEQLSDEETLTLLARRQVENAIPPSERFYCPYNDCSTLQLLPQPHPPPFASTSAAPSVGEVECMACYRQICADCRVPWHAGMSCDEFQELPAQLSKHGDAKVLNLARSKKWQRCQKCGEMVELRSGCFHITCRCGHEFCYRCGGKWINPSCLCGERARE